MNEREKKKKELKEKSRQAREQADELLEDELMALQNATYIDLESIRPQVTDEVIYDELIAAIVEATDQNEDLAQFKMRIENLGETVIKMGKNVVKLLTVV
jgi:hypothetical protein